MARKRCWRIPNARKLHRNSQLHKKKAASSTGKSSTKTDESRTVTARQKTRDAAGTGFFREAWPSLGAWPTISVFPTVYSIRKKRQKRRRSGFFLICAADIYLFFVSFFVLFQFFQNWNDFKKGMRGKREGRMRMWIRFFICCCRLSILFSVFSASSKILNPFKILSFQLLFSIRKGEDKKREKRMRSSFFDALLLIFYSFFGFF